ncbi:MAG: hypothetical protein CM15mP115_22510 [Alphaproteobacteria bacterium]|nr:MAG: hypothetical protein CM15mP115_22510 [Alphaproteobacteria bacterium]
MPLPRMTRSMGVLLFIFTVPSGFAGDLAGR